MAITHKTDHIEDALSLLLGQYQGRLRLEAWLASYIRRVQELEDATWDVINKRLIDNAEGAQLDIIGKIVGEDRAGKEDPLYRLYIEARIRVNRSSGRPRDIIEVARILESTAFEYHESALADVELHFGTEPEFASDDDLREAIGSLLQETAAAGTKVHLIYAVGETSFFFGEEDEQSLSENGFGLPPESDPAPAVMVADWFHDA